MLSLPILVLSLSCRLCFPLLTIPATHVRTHRFPRIVVWTPLRAMSEAQGLSKTQRKGSISMLLRMVLLKKMHGMSTIKLKKINCLTASISESIMGFVGACVWKNHSQTSCMSDTLVPYLDSEASLWILNLQHLGGFKLGCDTTWHWEIPDVVTWCFWSILVVSRSALLLDCLVIFYNLTVLSLSLLL